ncbi:MAG: exodeoxyribonuclease VII small subunit [Dysgonamonadaceae bacterium]|jgi:exodeoxyribonuclease VII small subunit|nr:exodeoxyribonuclease VII small subunit [Dysgonamonadaceae bacterium]
MNKEKGIYEKSYARLQEIQNLIESNRLDVDELSDILKEASQLLKVCKDKLSVVSEETKKILEDIK